MKINILKFKALISTLLIIIVILMFITGGVLYFSEYGMWLVFTRKAIKNFHVFLALIMGLCVIIHFALNFKTYAVELRKLGEKRE